MQTITYGSAQAIRSQTELMFITAGQILVHQIEKYNRLQTESPTAAGRRFAKKELNRLSKNL